MINFLLAALVAYLFGSLPSGVWIGKIAKNIDIRDYGSKNSGATNAYRVLGPKYGIAVLIADALKGYIPLMIADYLFGLRGTPLILIGLLAIVGHSLSFFLKFKGGKGVATSLGVFLFLFPNGILIVFAAFVLVVAFTKYISLASIIAAGLLPLLALFLPLRAEIPRFPLFIVSLLVAIFVIYRHKTNIERLLKGTENKFNLNPKKK